MDMFVDPCRSLKINRKIMQRALNKDDRVKRYRFNKIGPF